MAADGKEKESSSTLVIAISLLLALGAAGGVYYFYDQAQTAENALERSKGEYKKMAAGKKAVEEFIRQRKGRPAASPEDNQDLMTFLDRKARESQIPAGSFNVTKNSDMALTAWKESSYTVLFPGGKDTPVKKLPIVEFLRRVEAERRTVKVKSLQLGMSGDDFKSASITFSQFTPK